MSEKKLTTTGGAPVADNQNVMTAGPRGPIFSVFWSSETGMPCCVVRVSTPLPEPVDAPVAWVRR